MVLLLELVEMVQLGLVKTFKHRALLGRVGLVAGQLVEVERIELELHGVADGAEAHGVAQVASGDDLQLAAAHEALAVGNGEASGEFEATLAAPGIAHLRAADLVFFQDSVALRTRGWHIKRSPRSRLTCTLTWRARRACRLPWPGSRWPRR